MTEMNNYVWMAVGRDIVAVNSVVIPSPLSNQEIFFYTPRLFSFSFSAILFLTLILSSELKKIGF